MKQSDSIKLNKTVVRRILLIACSLLLVFSVFKLGTIFLDYKKSENVYSDIKDIYYNSTNTQEEVQASETNSPHTPAPSTIEPSVVKNTEQAKVSQPSPTPSPSVVYKDPKIARQTFGTLKKINKDIVGWINIPDTRIDYPVLKGKDNKYYLTHSVNNEKIRNASIFMDYRNDAKNLDFNTIIYGHNMHDGSMFANIPMYKKELFFNKNPYIYFDTVDSKYKWEVFSVYVTDTKFDYLMTGFKTEQECKKFINTIIEKSLFKNDIDVSPADRILTLSTCSYEFKSARTVLHAKLIKSD
jgi:sortase, SrtB family